LARMEKRGLIKKVKDIKRKNIVSVEVTEKGYEAYNETTSRESIKGIMTVLNNDEMVELWSHLSKIRNRTMERLGMEIEDFFPPSDHREL
ncbi:hypothetical protein ACFLU1_04200, partial [Chloroflexota bacterium]